MVQNNKILTVSYGTFSCTLEGFDDSFGTMKAIAEYFRDLASNDRYFGAEPPVPDAEMLARIAEKEIARRVEARFDEDGLVLRAGSMIEQAPPQEDVKPEHSAGETAAQPAVTADVASDHDTAIANAPEEKEEPVQVAETVAPVLPEDPKADEPEAETLIPQAKTPTPPLTSDSIAAKLARIRAVVAKQDASRAEYTEDQHAENFLATAAQDISEIIGEDVEDTGSDIGGPENAIEVMAAETVEDIAEETAEVVDDAVAQDPSEDSPDDAAEDTANTDELAMILGKLDAHEARQDLLSEDDGEEDDFDDGDDLRNILADDDDAPEAAEIADAPQEEPSEAAPQDLTDEQSEEAVGDSAQEPEAPAKPMRARVIKVSREEFDRAMAEAGEGQAPDAASADVTAGEEDARREDVAQDAAAQEDQDTLAAGLLDPDEEDALRQELAQIEAEIGSEAETATAPEPEKGDRADRVPARTALPDPLAEEDALSRLMAEAETKMEAPEQSRRRDEFARMRAAVAARAAEGNDDADATDPETEYRRDLATVVRPRRPDAAPTGRSERPNAPRIPPLKLVAEQRIDSPDRPRTAEQPVRPRRVPSPMQVVAEEMAVEGRTSFREFAASVGARELTEMLEAAAAYLSIVEGRDEFSRPQVMNKIRAIKEDDFSREDGLRSFGQLLREGKIERTRSGRFTTSESIGYQPEARSAG